MTPFKRSLALQAAGVALIAVTAVVGASAEAPLRAALAVAGLTLWALGLYLASTHLQKRIDATLLQGLAGLHEQVCIVRALLPADDAGRQRVYEAYARLHEDMAGIFESQPESAARRAALLAHSQGTSLLEVGCSTGGIAARARDMGFTTAVGMDISRHALTLGVPGVGYVQGDAYHLPFVDAGFDTVILPEVLEHLHEPRQAITEALRVARRRIVATIPLGPMSDPTHVATYEEDSARALFDDVEGLRVIASERVCLWLVVSCEPVG
jgi:SAM-dependent methyltransferase